MDIYLAFILSTITNLFIGAYGKKGSKGVELKDFVLDWWGDNEPKEQTPTDMKDFLLGFAKAHNARLEKDKKNNLKKKE